MRFSGHQLAHAARDRAGDGRPVDAAILRALHAHGALQAEAARFEIEQRLLLVEAHQQLGACARGAAHLDAARGIGRGEKGLRPRRVVAVDEALLGAVDRDRLGIGGEAGHADPELLRLFARALKQRPPASDRGADRAGDGVRPGIARDPHRRLDLVEAERDRGRGVRRHLQRIVLGVGHVRLVAGRLARAHLAVGEGDLERRQLRHHLGELGRRHAVRKPHQLAPRHVHIDQHARDLVRGHRHRFRRDLGIDVIAGDEGVDHVEIGGGRAVHRLDPARSHGQSGLRIVTADEGGEAVLGVLDRELVEPERALVPVGEALPAIGEVARLSGHGGSRLADVRDRL